MSDKQPALAEHIVNIRTIGENAAWTIFGRVGPMLVAVALTPELMRQFGPDRWGVFSIALTLIGIFGIFDFGIGRVITRNIAEAIALGTVEQLAAQVKTSLAALLALGLCGSVIMGALVEYWVRSTLKIPTELTSEVRLSLYLLCLAVPLVLLGSGMWGILSAHQQSKAAAMISTPALVMYYAGPLLVFSLFRSLVAVIALIVGLRLVVTILFWRLCKRLIPQLSQARVDIGTLRPVLRLSGWMTVSNLLFPVLTYADRILIASLYPPPRSVIMRPPEISSPASIWYQQPSRTRSSRPWRPHNPRTRRRFARSFRRATVMITTILFPVAALCLLFGDKALAIMARHGDRLAYCATAVLVLSGTGLRGGGHAHNRGAR